MSPAATVDSRHSSNPSSSTMNSSFPNFNLEGTNASSYINGSECSFNSGSSIPSMVRNGSMLAARPKVRLHKKRANSRPSRSSPSTADSDFNPFRLVADQLKNSDGENVKLGESHNSGSVFGANRSNSSVVLNSENGNDVGSISREKTERGEGCSNSHNAGFVSGYSRVPLSSKSVEQSEAVEKLVSDDKLSCSDRGSVPGSNDSKSVSSLSSEDGGLGRNAENLVNGEGEREKFRTNIEKEKIENVQFVFGSSCFVRECNHGVDKGEDGLKTIATSSECERNANFGVEFRNVDDLSFVFSAGSTNLPPNSVKENDFLENSTEKPPPKDENCGSISSRSQIEENINTGVDSEDCGKKDVVFGDNGVQSAENITSEKEEFIDNLGKSVLDDMQKTNLDAGAQYVRKPAHCVSFDVDNVRAFDSNKGWEQGVFVFGSSTEASSSRQKRTAAKESDEVKVENIVDDGGVFKDQRANMCPAEFYSEAKLSNELKKLYINTIEKIDHASRTHPSTMRTCTDVNDIFIFKSNKVDSGSSTERPEVSPDNPSTSYSEENRDNGVGNISGKSNHSSEEVQNFDPLDNDGIKLNGDAGPSSVPPGHSTQPNYKMYSTCVDERNFEFSIASSSNGSGASSMDLKKPLQNPLFSFSVNLSQGLNRKVDLGAKTRVATGQKMKRTKGKAKQPNPAKQHPLQESLSSRSTPQVNIDSSECYSPMDFSPYEESVAADERAVETSETPEGPPFNEKSHAPFDANYTTVSLDAKGEKLTAGYSGINNGVNITSDNAEAGLASNMGAQENGRANSFAASSLLDGREKFAFTAAASGPSHMSSISRQGKKKYRMKTGLGSSASSFIQGAPINDTANKFQGENEILSTAENKEKHKFIAGEEQEPLSALTVAEKACDKWRLRGNQAYKDGELSKAEDFYTWGINCLPSGEMSGSSVKPLVLCYSNRAATRMAVGKVRQALQDCLSAARLDPDFLKAQLRAANCHLLLGELEDALQNYHKCLESEHDVCLDRQVVIAASDGLQKAQRVMEFTNRSAELLKLRTSEHAAGALELIAEAMSISSYSEKLLKMKAEALCMLQKYEEAIQLCRKTFDFAEKNFTLTVAENLVVDHSSWKNEMNVRLWRLYILSKCCFCLGRLESALDVLEKRDCGDMTGESSHPLAVTIRELLKHKNAGNEAFQSGKHAEAIEHYTSAISSSVESRPFAAICFCNRAAAHQALGQIADAISDCSLAIALDENYAKAVSRRATLHEVIRDYKQASADLQRLVSLLEKQSHEKGKQSGSKSEKELRQAYKRLSIMESEAKKGIPLNLYLILGVKRSDSASEIKKAYRKAALRHHPDKAAQAVVKSENGDDGKLWKDIANLVHKDSDRLFKMIGEAYAVLSDTEKRSEYDLKEDMQNATKDSSNVRSTSRRQTDAHNYSYYPSERSSTRQYWNESHYRTYRDDSDPFSKWYST